MAIFKGPRVSPDGGTVLLSDNYTLRGRDLNGKASYTCSAALTITLPTPVKDYANKPVLVVNNSSGNVGLSCTGGFLRDGNSMTVPTATSITLWCVKTAIGTYRWDAQGIPEAGAVSVPVKATGAEVDTGTNDTKFVTPKAIEDSSYVKTAAIPVKASTVEIDAGVDDAKFLTAAGIAASNYATKDEISTPSPVQLGASIAACAAKTVPLLADSLVVGDSAAGGLAKESTLTQIQTTLFTPVATGFMGYHRTGLTGGTASDLDGIAYASLADGMRARVTVGNNPGVVHDYAFDIDNAGGESSPDTIAPDDAGAEAGRWVLVTLDGNMYDYGTVANTACQGNDGRLPTTAQKAALFDYLATSLIGGGAGALDAIDGAALVDGDTAVVFVGNNPAMAHFYVLDADNAGAESSPDTIAPDANGGDKRWILATANGSMGDYGATAITACVGNDARIPTTEENTALVQYYRTGLIGGAGTDLDGIDGAALTDGMRAVVIVGNNPGVKHEYVLDADNAGAEASPGVIQPDANGGDKRWVLITLDGDQYDFGAEPGAVSTSTSGQAGTAETASRSDHNHDLGAHVHSTGNGDQLTMPVALSDYTAPAVWIPVLDWTTATPAGMVIIAEYMKVGKLIKWWLHIVTSDPGAPGTGTLNTIAFPEALQPADVGADTIHFDVHGIHRKDTGAADTWTALMGRLDVAAAAGADRKVYVKNDVAWADNEVTELFMSGEHYTA